MGRKKPRKRKRKGKRKRGRTYRKCFVFGKVGIVVIVCNKISECGGNECRVSRKFIKEGYDVVCVNPKYDRSVDEVVEEELKLRELIGSLKTG